MTQASDFPVRTAIVNSVIANNASLSGIVDLGGCSIVGMYVPASFGTTAITFLVSADGTNFFSLRTNSGSEYTVGCSATVASAVTINPMDFVGFRFMKVQSGTSAVPVNVTGPLTIPIVCRPVQ